MALAARGRGPALDRPWREAIRRAVARAHKGEKTKKLERLADKLVSEGLGGDIAALREIGDRLDGKAVQPHAGDETGPPIEHVHRIEHVIVDPKNRNS